MRALRARRLRKPDFKGFRVLLLPRLLSPHIRRPRSHCLCWMYRGARMGPSCNLMSALCNHRWMASVRTHAKSFGEAHALSSRFTVRIRWDPLRQSGTVLVPMSTTGIRDRGLHKHSSNSSNICKWGSRRREFHARWICNSSSSGGRGRSRSRASYRIPPRTTTRSGIHGSSRRTSMAVWSRKCSEEERKSCAGGTGRKSGMDNCGWC
mmetsp:Transcript_111862/g.321360  ORF Transcript_111862/g.321360 Transcript_111862/m.321360 type:complete len:208 (-) Transcript_111862:518-1141(-)